MVKIYNTATRTIEDFKPIKEGEVSLYACGPTVYHYAHIGNMRAYITQDILARVLRHNGYDVKHAMNITDVGHLQSDGDEGEDKMSIAAKREQRSVWDIAKHYEDAFFDHAKKLNITRPDVVCRATDHIPDMIKMVEELIERGHAYESGGNVYFDVSSFERYTDFAQQSLDDGQQTDRIETDPLKRDQNDFVLWFSQSKYPNQIMKWESPWGVGFPGWHIECSAMATKYLGKHFDIHCGGIDHVRVHHTNEIAQSECAHGCADGSKPWVNYWVHNEFIQVADSKMSKSKGDTITVDSLTERGFDPLAYRYWLLTGHYRNQMSFSYDSLEQAQATLKRLRRKVNDLKESAGNTTAELSDKAKSYQTSFWIAVSDDLGTAEALAIMHEMLKSDEVSDAEKLELMRNFDLLFDLNIEREEKVEVNDNVQSLVDAREEARKAKDFSEADRIKEELKELGFVVKDTREGPILEAV